VKALASGAAESCCSGHQAVEGSFRRGEMVVLLWGPDGLQVARGWLITVPGRCAHSLGSRRNAVAKILGYLDEPEDGHRDIWCWSELTWTPVCVASPCGRLIPSQNGSPRSPRRMDGVGWALGA